MDQRNQPLHSEFLQVPVPVTRALCAMGGTIPKLLPISLC